MGKLEVGTIVRKVLESNLSEDIKQSVVHELSKLNEPRKFSLKETNEKNEREKFYAEVYSLLKKTKKPSTASSLATTLTASLEEVISVQRVSACLRQLTNRGVLDKSTGDRKVNLYSVNDNDFEPIVYVYEKKVETVEEIKDETVEGIEEETDNEN